MKKELIYFLFAEIFVVLSTISIFKLVDSPKTAGIIAGCQFSVLSIFIFYKLFSKFLHPLKTASLYANSLLFFGSTLPMLFTRITNFSKNFDDLKVFGLPGHAFHMISEKIYLILILSTILDMVIFYFFFKGKETR